VRKYRSPLEEMSKKKNIPGLKSFELVADDDGVQTGDVGRTALAKIERHAVV